MPTTPTPTLPPTPEDIETAQTDHKGDLKRRPSEPAIKPTVPMHQKPRTLSQGNPVVGAGSYPITPMSQSQAKGNPDRKHDTEDRKHDASVPKSTSFYLPPSVGKDGYKTYDFPKQRQAEFTEMLFNTTLEVYRDNRAKPNAPSGNIGHFFGFGFTAKQKVAAINAYLSNDAEQIRQNWGPLRDGTVKGFLDLYPEHWNAAFKAVHLEKNPPKQVKTTAPVDERAQFRV